MERRPFTDWPHLILPGVDGPEINKLERLVRPKVKGKRMSTGGKLLGKGKMSDTPFICVSRVEAEFLAPLLHLTDGELAGLAKAWLPHVSRGELSGLTDLVRSMAEFVKQVEAAGKTSIAAR